MLILLFRLTIRSSWLVIEKNSAFNPQKSTTLFLNCKYNY
ncbi:hypothetical protein P782_1248 [Enterococcus faecalis FL2]|nr:hypothetical protein EF62_0022 [Enterococcus faecalis 62]AHI41664.1 Hypothetical protein DENG_02816 [Enterococcus faecalis DENG1]EFG21724.1 hypothetical protein CUI_0762 [Enterococcus faecalis PC1.1]EFK76959.1 hypothetical protein HMPREF0347_6339 [Enterococcus faecalis TUSoD Ef11]ELA01519.1 hypothetical protein OG1X_2613 [Enterococcus faecalis OG1X]ELA04547.1 hypothetical protein EFM7_2256 [Enterococcus faecalis M7]ERL09948.1 hypothetical protein HMPREF1160_2733 [Enterococcus faecalis E12]